MIRETSGHMATLKMNPFARAYIHILFLEKNPTSKEKRKNPNLPLCNSWTTKEIVICV